MGKPISLFSGYSQRENRTTNYCLLVLKLLYEENPRFLLTRQRNIPPSPSGESEARGAKPIEGEGNISGVSSPLTPAPLPEGEGKKTIYLIAGLIAETFGALLGEDIADHVGVTFRQQEKKTLSVPDGLIVRKPITIFLETKNFDWFYDEQLENHLAGLEQDSAGLKVLIALGHFENDDNSRFARIQALCKDKYRGEILFAALTFEDFIAALQLPHLPKSLVDTVSELRAYLDEEGLLPSWSDWLDVVNCAGIPEDILEANVYMCPTTGGAYSHDRCAFFGMYRNKRVERIADILAVVDVESESSATIKWKNAPDDDSTLKKKAIEIVLQRRPDGIPTRVFLLAELFETDFVKDSPGGMMGSKQYFNVARLGVKTAQEVASALRGKAWSDIQSSDS